MLREILGVLLRLVIFGIIIALALMSTGCMGHKPFYRIKCAPDARSIYLSDSSLRSLGNFQCRNGAEIQIVFPHELKKDPTVLGPSSRKPNVIRSR